MFEEVNGYIRAKGAEFDAKKVPFNEQLFAKVKLEHAHSPQNMLQSPEAEESFREMIFIISECSTGSRRI